jgi:hypothetical protein
MSNRRGQTLTIEESMRIPKKRIFSILPYQSQVARNINNSIWGSNVRRITWKFLTVYKALKKKLVKIDFTGAHPVINIPHLFLLHTNLQVYPNLQDQPKSSRSQMQNPLGLDGSWCCLNVNGWIKIFSHVVIYFKSAVLPRIKLGLLGVTWNWGGPGLANVLNVLTCTLQCHIMSNRRGRGQTLTIEDPEKK